MPLPITMFVEIQILSTEKLPKKKKWTCQLPNATYLYPTNKEKKLEQRIPKIYIEFQDIL